MKILRPISHHHETFATITLQLFLHVAPKEFHYSKLIFNYWHFAPMELGIIVF